MTLPVRDYGGKTADQRRQERRERLLRSALELFGSQGYTATSIERLCSTAGVSTRNFYQEFNGREQLLIALHERITVESVDAVAAALGEAHDAKLRTRIELAVRALIGVTARDARTARVAYVEVVGVSAAVEKHRLIWRDRWAQVMRAEAERAASRGEAVPRDYHLSVYAVMGAVNELVHHWTTAAPEVPVDQVSEELTRLIVGMLTTA